MIPIRFEIRDNTTYFYYDLTELKNFVKLGRRSGDVGLILTRRKDNMFTYRGFGTIENPHTWITTLSIIHNDLIDGKMSTDEERLITVRRSYSKGDYKFVILNLSDER